MFELRNVYVEDKHLGEVMRALAGLLIKPPLPVPIINAQVEKGKIVTGPAGNLPDMLAEQVKTTKATIVTPEYVRQWLKAQGRAGSSSTYLIQQLIKRRLLKKTKKIGQYLVIAKSK